jgi:hypothetical protein
MAEAPVVSRWGLEYTGMHGKLRCLSDLPPYFVIQPMVFALVGATLANRCQIAELRYLTGTNQPNQI